MPIGKVQTGVTTTLRLGSEDASVEAKKIVDKATQEAKAIKPIKNQIKYIKIGEPVFNCFSKKGRRIEFSGGVYLVDRASPIANDIIESLQYFVDIGLLSREEGEV